MTLFGRTRSFGVLRHRGPRVLSEFAAGLRSGARSPVPLGCPSRAGRQAFLRAFPVGMRGILDGKVRLSFLNANCLLECLWSVLVG